MDKYALVEKRNHLARHNTFATLERAEKFLKEVIPFYVSQGFFMDKTLTADDFEIVENKR